MVSDVGTGAIPAARIRSRSPAVGRLQETLLSCIAPARDVYEARQGRRRRRSSAASGHDRRRSQPGRGRLSPFGSIGPSARTYGTEHASWRRRRTQDEFKKKQGPGTGTACDRLQGGRDVPKIQCPMSAVTWPPSSAWRARPRILPDSFAPSGGLMSSHPPSASRAQHPRAGESLIMSQMMVRAKGECGGRLQFPRYHHRLESRPGRLRFVLSATTMTVRYGTTSTSVRIRTRPRFSAGLEESRRPLHKQPTGRDRSLRTSAVVYVRIYRTLLEKDQKSSSRLVGMMTERLEHRRCSCHKSRPEPLPLSAYQYFRTSRWTPGRRQSSRALVPGGARTS